MSNIDPYEDYDPERAKYQGVWFGVVLAALLVVSGLVYMAAHQTDNVASAPPAPNASEPSTTGSNSSR
jgi:hypothetical protein